MSRAPFFSGPATAESITPADSYDLVDVMDEENQEWLPLNAPDEAAPASQGAPAEPPAEPPAD